MEPSTTTELTDDAAPSASHPLGELMPAREWVQQHGKPVFHSYDSFDWFVRQHQQEFASCHDWIVTGKGRYCGPGMAAFVRTLLDQDTRASMQRIAAAQVAPAPAVNAKRLRGRPRKQA
jgi:hypothetical protein